MLVAWTGFIVTGLYWLGYHRQLHFMERFDGGALVINLLYLMSVACLPFPTLLLNHYFASVSVIFYASAWQRTASCSGVSGSTPVGAVCYGTSTRGSAPTSRFGPCSLR